jgi:chromosome segregation ATPase
MPIDQMTILEKRVHQILEMLKRLKQDNVFLEQKVKTIGQRLAQRERDRLRWNHDRVRLRSKVERILSEMETLPARLHPTEGRRDARPGKRGGT